MSENNLSDFKLNPITEALWIEQKELKPDYLKDIKSIDIKNLVFDISNNSNTAVNIKKYDEKKFYNWVSELIDLYWNEWENLEKFAEKLWELINSMEIPLDLRFINRGTLEMIKEINNWWKINTWIWTHIVPLWLTNLRTLIENDIIETKNINLNLWNINNLQEKIWFTKQPIKDPHEWATKEFIKWDKINKLHIKSWEWTSFAHMVNFELNSLWNKQYELDVELWKNVFLWIMSHICSWVKIWDNSTVWWGATIEKNVSIWKHSTIWQWATIKEWVNIWDNILVPNWAIIENNEYETIKYEDYIKNEVQYDKKNTWKYWRRNFIIEIYWTNSKEKKEQLKEINESYYDMYKFNKSHVVPDNDLNAWINTLLWMIHEKVPNLWIIKTETFKSEVDFDKLAKKLNKKWKFDKQDLEILKNEDSKLVMIAHPKNKKEFVNGVFKKFLEANEKWEITEELINEIKNSLYFPKIPKNYKKIFYWRNVFIGNWEIIENLKTNENSEEEQVITIWNSCFRNDETKEWEIWIIEDCNLHEVVCHWWWWMKIINSTYIYSTLHWETEIINSYGWDSHHPSVINSSIIENSTLEWWVVANQTEISDSKVWHKVILMPWSKIIDDSIIWDHCIIWQAELKNCEVYKNLFIWNRVNEEDLVITWSLYERKKTKPKFEIS